MRRAVSAIGGLSLIVAASAAWAQPTPGAEVARATFDEGVALEKAGDYARALEKFTESAAIRETSGVLFHRAYCMEMSKQDLIATVEAYEKAERLAQRSGPPAVVAAVKKQLEPLRAKLAQITLRVAPRAKDLEVWLDGRVIALALLDKAFRIEPGEHNVEAKAPGFKPFRKLVRADPGSDIVADVKLEPAPSAAGAAPPPPTPPQSADAPPETATLDPPSDTPRAGGSVALPVALTAGAVVLAGVGVGAFVAAGSRQESARVECLSRVDCEDLKRSVGTLDAIALGAWIGAAGLGAFAAVSWLTLAPSKAAASGGPARIGLTLHPGGVGVSGVLP